MTNSGICSERPSRLKGIETVTVSSIIIESSSSERPSRLKGIETQILDFQWGFRYWGSERPSRLKGIETIPLLNL